MSFDWPMGRGGVKSVIRITMIITVSSLLRMLAIRFIRRVLRDCLSMGRLGLLPVTVIPVSGWDCVRDFLWKRRNIYLLSLKSDFLVIAIRTTELLILEVWTSTRKISASVSIIIFDRRHPEEREGIGKGRKTAFPVPFLLGVSHKIRLISSRLPTV